MELEGASKLRAELAGLGPAGAAELLAARLREAPTNAEVLSSL